MLQCLTGQLYSSQDIRDGVSMRCVPISPISAIPGHNHSAAYEIRLRFHTWPQNVHLKSTPQPSVTFLNVQRFKGSNPRGPDKLVEVCMIQ